MPGLARERGTAQSACLNSLICSYAARSCPRTAPAGWAPVDTATYEVVRASERRGEKAR